MENLVALGLLIGMVEGTRAADVVATDQALRVATYNVSFYRDRQGQLVDDLERGDRQAKSIAEVIQRVRPHILLLNEFDFDADLRGAELFCDNYLAKSQEGQPPIAYPYRFSAPVNTGVPTSIDLDQDGASDGPGDAYGWGRYPGQYGMLVLSQFPIDEQQVRTFQKFLWKDMPERRIPNDPASGTNYYTAEQYDLLRLSSKSFWDVPIEVAIGERNFTLHLLCSHPTPPGFDGPEDRNGARNHDEVRMVADYIDRQRSGYLYDDRGQTGGLAQGAHFVIAGDLNADPADGNASADAIRKLLASGLVHSDPTPQSKGAVASFRQHAELNRQATGDPRHHTANFSGDGFRNLRVDYVLPSKNLAVRSSGVFWPLPGEPASAAVRATDHRPVWVDLASTATENQTGKSDGG